MGTGLMIHGQHHGRDVTAEFDYAVAELLQKRAQEILEKARKKNPQSRMAQMYAAEVEGWEAVLITPELLTESDHPLIQTYLNHVLYDQDGFDRMFGK